MKITFDIIYSYGKIVAYRGVIPNWSGNKPEYYRSGDYPTKQEAKEVVLLIFNKEK
tara:strand:- start:423 stop:590 length:168 start_codon:yes stop_codon:yes gene_type:complete